jgi:hypothetical protein
MHSSRFLVPRLSRLYISLEDHAFDNDLIPLPIFLDVITMGQGMPFLELLRSTACILPKGFMIKFCPNSKIQVI